MNFSQAGLCVIYLFIFCIFDYFSLPISSAMTNTQEMLKKIFMVYISQHTIHSFIHSVRNWPCLPGWSFPVPFGAGKAGSFNHKSNSGREAALAHAPVQQIMTLSVNWSLSSPQRV